MNGHSLTRLARTTPMTAFNKPFEMNEKRESTSSATASNHGSGKLPEGRSTRLQEESLGGKDHTVGPAGTPDEKIFVEDGSKVLGTKVPGAIKTSIAEEFTRKYQPGMSAYDAPEEHVGNSPSGVGISHQWMEAKR
ncbi:MAG: hypothetical protein BMS9Abin37_1379 [Acidobacteriota bacterium]|nr:MAG: hypothetical protein BMS9Abin37_1379 [Acidobacteriota bacterium]